MKKMRILAAAAAALACLWSCEDPIVDDIIAEVSVSPASITFEAEGGTLKVAVNANVDFDITGSPEWLKIEKNGKELSVTAEANTVNQPRSGEVTLTAGTASAKLSVSQKAGSAYSGFISCTQALFEYAGTMLYQFLKPLEEDYGGQGYIAIADEEGNGVAIWVYTELFASEEEVTLTPGTYVKGNDNYPTLYGKVLTFAPGVLVTFGEEDEDPYIGGSYYINGTTEQKIALVDGTVEVTAGNDGNYTIKADMVGADGISYRYVYEGQVEIDAEGAAYPGESERIDVGNTVFAAECYYYGDKYENGTSNFELYVYSGDTENFATTVFEFNAPAVEFSETIDLSGEYYLPEEEDYSAGTLVPGSLVEVIPGFSMAFGTYVMYEFGDYIIGDGYDTLVLTKKDDGTYNFMGAIMSAAEESVMFFGPEFSGYDLEIEIYDGRDEGGED